MTLAASTAHAADKTEARPETETATQLNELVVTGEKFGRTVKDSATSVGLVTSAEIEANSYLESRDAFQSMVNVNVAGANGRYAIRGVPFDNVNGVGVGALSTTYVDGIRLSDKAVRFGPDLLWDVSSIEVLRGAQSTLQGRNALGGAIYINSEDPKFDWHAAGRLMVQSQDGYDEAAMVTGPIIKDVLAFRLSGEAHTTGGPTTDPVLKSDRVDFADDAQIRGKLLFKPTDTLTVLATGIYANIKRRDAASDTRILGADGFLQPNPATQPGGTASNFESGVVGVASPDRRETFVNVPEYDTTHTAAWGLKADWKLTPSVTLTSESTYEHTSNYKQRDGDGGAYSYNYTVGGVAQSTYAVTNPFHIGPFAGYIPASGVVPVDPANLQAERFDIFSQELRARYDNGGALRGLVGAYYTRESKREDNLTQLVFRNVRPSIVAAAIGLGHLTAAQANLFASFYSVDAPLYTFNSEPVLIHNKAVYGEGEWDITPRLTLNGGLRYDTEDNVQHITNSGTVLGLADPALLPAAFRPLAIGINSSQSFNPFKTATQTSNQSFDAWLPKAGLRYRVSDDLTVGGVIQRAYRAGGSSNNVVRQIVTPLAPEYTWNYELYLRTSFMDKRGRLNANVYYTDWTNQQTEITLSTQQSDVIGVNAGHSQLYGFETELNFELTNEVSLHAGLGYSHTEFTSFAFTVPAAATPFGIPIDPHQFDKLVGNAFPYAPQWSGVLGASWRNADGWFANANANYSDVFFSDTANTRKGDARVLVSARAGRELGRVTAAVFVRNLFDATYVQDPSPDRPLVGEPRMVGATLEVRY